MFFAMIRIVTPGPKARSAVFAPDPGVHLPGKTMDGRVEPGHDFES
jgi:hypothetical protein